MSCEPENAAMYAVVFLIIIYIVVIAFAGMYSWIFKSDITGFWDAVKLKSWWAAALYGAVLFVDFVIVQNMCS